MECLGEIVLLQMPELGKNRVDSGFLHGRWRAGSTHLEEVLQLPAAVQGGDAGGELQQVFRALPSLLNDSLVKSP